MSLLLFYSDTKEHLAECDEMLSVRNVQVEEQIFEAVGNILQSVWVVLRIARIHRTLQDQQLGLSHIQCVQKALRQDAPERSTLNQWICISRPMTLGLQRSFHSRLICGSENLGSATFATNMSGEIKVLL
jgi:hypothetical protein